jgi:hypothetical protein
MSALNTGKQNLMMHEGCFEKVLTFNNRMMREGCSEQ